MNENIKQFLKHEDYTNVLIGINLARIEGYSDIEIFDELANEDNSSMWKYDITEYRGVKGYHFNLYDDYEKEVYDFSIHYSTFDLDYVTLKLETIPHNNEELYQQTFNKFKQLFIEYLMEGKYFNL